MALRLTQLLTEMGTRRLFWGLKAAGTRVDNLNIFHVPIVCKFWSLKVLSRPVMG
jgi:hypothetical protein